MILETIFGAATGGIFGLISPIIGKGLDIWDRKSQFNQQLELLKVRSELSLTEADARASIAEARGIYDHDRSLQSSGWVSTFRAMTRPALTWLFFGLYAAIKGIAVYHSVIVGASITMSILNVWTPTDQAIFVGIMAFWFSGRAIDKQLKRLDNQHIKPGGKRGKQK